MPRGERHCVPKARLAGGEQSAQREIATMRWPIRHSLFGSIPGRQACAAGWASADPWRQAQRAASHQDEAKRGQRPRIT